MEKLNNKDLLNEKTGNNFVFRPITGFENIISNLSRLESSLDAFERTHQKGQDGFPIPEVYDDIIKQTASFIQNSADKVEKSMRNVLNDGELYSNVDAMKDYFADYSEYITGKRLDLDTISQLVNDAKKLSESFS
jgi:hypothetical protein